MEMTLARFEDLLRTGSEATRGYLLAKLMREARPDDVFLFVTVSDMRRLWPHLEALGQSAPVLVLAPRGLEPVAVTTGRLTPLQERVLGLLAGMEPKWTLTRGEPPSPACIPVIVPRGTWISSGTVSTIWERWETTQPNPSRLPAFESSASKRRAPSCAFRSQMAESA
ncbi:MAG: hypothetical protein ACE5F1_22790 [Planctomycetota bacterium]